MLVIGCDFHPSWQPVYWGDTITGETEEKKLVHGSGEAEANRSHLDLGSAAETATLASDLDAVMRLVYDTASCAPRLRWMIVFWSV